MSSLVITYLFGVYMVIVLAAAFLENASFYTYVAEFYMAMIYKYHKEKWLEPKEDALGKLNNLILYTIITLMPLSYIGVFVVLFAMFMWLKDGKD